MFLKIHLCLPLCKHFMIDLCGIHLYSTFYTFSAFITGFKVVHICLNGHKFSWYKCRVTFIKCLCARRCLREHISHACFSYFFGCIGSLLLQGLFSSCGEQGRLSSCGVWAFRCGGFSCCGTWALGLMIVGSLIATSDGSPLQDSSRDNPMDRGAWWDTVQGVSKSQTGLSD